MAFTLATEPQLLTPAFNPIIYRSISDIYTATGFKYIYKVYCNGTLVENIKCLPMPDNYGLADIHKVLKNYVTRFAQPSVTTHTPTPYVVKYYVEAGEEVNGGIVTAVTNQATVVTLTIENNTDGSLSGKQVGTLILNGLTLSHSAPYYLKNIGTDYGLYRDSFLTLPVTATGTFDANGFVQTTDLAIETTSIINETTGENIALDMVIPIEEYPNVSSYVGSYVNNAFYKKFLTKAPRTKNISRSEVETLSYLQQYQVVNNVAYAKVSAYDSTGVLIGTDDYANTYNSWYDAGTETFFNASYLRLDFGVGYTNLYLANAANHTTNAACTYYTVQFFDVADAAISETFTYNIVEPCSKYEKVRLIFLNSLGGYDFYTFNMLSDKSFKTDRSTYKQAMPYSYSPNFRSETTYHLQAEKVFVLKTDFVDTSTADWLGELYMSPDVNIITGYSTLTPITPVTDIYPYKTRGKDKLKQYAIEFKYSNKILSNI